MGKVRRSGERSCGRSLTTCMKKRSRRKGMGCGRGRRGGDAGTEEDGRRRGGEGGVSCCILQEEREVKEGEEVEEGKREKSRKVREQRKRRSKKVRMK